MLRRSILVIVFGSLTISGFVSRGQGQDASSSEMERRLIAAYKQVSPAVVRVESTDGTVRSRSGGVIVTEQGHVLTSRLPADLTLTFHFSDGRTAQGKSLGWSKEWGVSLAKLDGPGPWPIVKLAESPAAVNQPLMTLAYPPRDAIIASALLNVEWVIISSGQWFMTTDKDKIAWNYGGLTFDLDGKFTGFRHGAYPRTGTIYAGVSVIRSMWDDLVAGKNLDEVRLGGQAKDTDKATTITAEIERRATAASVQIRRKAGEKGFSGTVISADGMIATCAHYFLRPGTKVVVSLPDGRDLAGEVVGFNAPCDVGLLKITDSGPFPWVRMGDSTRLSSSDPCLAIGYGPVNAQERQPSVRRATIAPAPDKVWSCLLYSNAKTVGGDSGGGIFNSDGELVATHSQGYSVSIAHRVELLRLHWDSLLTPLQFSDASPEAALNESVAEAAKQIKSNVVEVLSGDKAVALGSIISTDGRLLTKASILPAKPLCRLADGRTKPANVIKTIREHDLAVLKIEATDLPVVEWSTSTTPPVGTLVGSATLTGVISHVETAFPAERGVIPARFRDSENGPEVEGIFEATGGNQPVRKGDIILSIEGRPTRDRKELLALLNDKENPVASAGDMVRVVLLREGKQTELAIVLATPSLRVAPRRSGFPRAFGVSTATKSEQFGSPVFDRDGVAIGIEIASRENGWLLVIPAATIMNFAAN